MSKKIILVTGAAGFIGYHICNSLLKQGHFVIGLDNVNDYYNVNLKYDRLKELGISRSDAESFNSLAVSSTLGDQFRFIRLNLQDRKALPELFKLVQFDSVCNLAAQAGVRYSIENPEAYVDSNITGFLNVLECCRHYNVNRLVYASSSSIYGNSDTVPFEETANANTPISLYAATKKSNELMAHTYSHLYNIETIGLRFFTVYGPWGRPDMAMFLFTDAILKGEPIKVFNNDHLTRDFTYVDDIVNGVENTLLKPSKDKALYKLYNIGNSQPVRLLDIIEAIEKNTGKTSERQIMPMQAGDVNQTWASIERLKHDYNYIPSIPIETGVEAFISWYKSYYNK